MYRLGGKFQQEVTILVWWDPLVCCEPNGRGAFFVDVGNGHQRAKHSNGFSNGDARPHAAAVTLTLTRAVGVLSFFSGESSTRRISFLKFGNKLLPCILVLALFVGFWILNPLRCSLSSPSSKKRINFLCSSTYFLVVARVSTHLVF